MERSVPVLFPQLYLPPVIGDPPLAAKAVAVTLFTSLHVGDPVPAGDIFQLAGNDAVAAVPIPSKFSETVEVFAMLICALTLWVAVINTNVLRSSMETNFIRVRFKSAFFKKTYKDKNKNI